MVFIGWFAVVVMLATGVSSYVGYQGVRRALERDFDAGLERAAESAAREIGPETLRDLGQRDEGAGDLALQVQLSTLRASTGIESASLIDTGGVTQVNDAGAGGFDEGRPSPLDSLAGPALRRALTGAPVVSPPYVRAGRTLKAGFAPVRGEAGRVLAVVAVEAVPAYPAVLADLGRTLTLVTVVTMLAIAILAVWILRGAWASARLERRLSRAENLAAMGRLTATLAHEIKNPLAIIRGSAERLGRLEPEARRMADFVVEETDRLSRTVARYLQFARGEQSAGEGGDALVALASTLALLEGELRARRITLERDDHGIATAPVDLDNESLKQLYLNLILNALDAMPEGGPLRVAVEERSGRVEVSIADCGQGIAPELLARLGEPFHTTKAGGSGLGVFLARRLAAGAGGELVIHSEVGRGTTCVVRLPRRRDK